MLRVGAARVALVLLVVGLVGSTGFLIWKLDKLTKVTVEKDQEVARIGVDRLQGTEYGNLEIPFDHRDIAIPPPKHDAARSRYIVEPPDVLDIEVFQALPGRPLTGERLVRPDGTITLGFYGDLHVAGLSLAEVKKKVVLHMRKYLNDYALGIDVPSPEDPERTIARINPEDSDRVFVDVAAYNSKVYYVEGDFNLPGRLPITGKETVLDALHLAGGLATSALHSSLRLVKPSKNSKPVVKQIKYESVISGEDMSTNYPLEPGDHLYVERDPKAKVEPNEQVVRENAAMLHELRTRVEELSKKLARSLEQPRQSKGESEPKAEAILEELFEPAIAKEMLDSYTKIQEQREKGALPHKRPGTPKVEKD
ncbi:MAG: polysaccharide biosynthesis/export family protein [Planctomycetota bacterium]|nr:polysaccharide biosynthesis/export family protein [Planctomycetota bacterium]